MEAAISFCSMANTLNDSEFNQFAEKLFSTISKRDIMIKSLFHLIAYECRINQNNYIDIINKTMTQIIHLKRENEINAINEIIEINSNNESESDTISTGTEPLSFNDIPQPIISQIGSYLKLNELSSFFKSDRYIYISCKSISTTIKSLIHPKWFREFSMNYGEIQRKHQLNKLNQFKMVKNIFVSTELIKNDEWIWSNLNKLVLCDITDNMIISNIIQNTNIKQLIIKRNNKFRANKVWNAICCNKSIEFLSMDSNLINMAETEPIHHLKGLKIEMIEYEEVINLNKICAQTMDGLQSIHITSNSDYYELNGKIGSNLKEIDIQSVDDYDLEIFIKSGKAINLQRMHWKLSSFDNFHNVLKVIFIKIPSLNYLYIDSNDCVQNVINPIIKSLRLTKRDNLKLEVNLNKNNDIDFVENYLDEIINGIQCGIRNDFMIIFNIGSNVVFLENEENFIKYGSSNNDIRVGITRKDINIKRIIISNIDNKMNGYKEEWIMENDEEYDISNDMLPPRPYSPFSTMSLMSIHSGGRRQDDLFSGGTILNHINHSF